MKNQKLAMDFIGFRIDKTRIITIKAIAAQKNYTVGKLLREWTIEKLDTLPPCGCQNE